MVFLRFILLLFRRNLKSISSSAIITFVIIWMVGITSLSIIAPYSVKITEILNEKNIVDIYAEIQQNSMNDMQFVDIVNTLRDINIEDLTINYGFILNFQINFQNETIPFPIIGLDENLMELLGYTETEIVVSSMISEVDQINITLSNQNSMKYYEMNTTNFVELNYSSLSDCIYDRMLSLEQSSRDYNTYYFNYFLLVNITVINQLVHYFDLKSQEISAFVLGFYNHSSISHLTIDELESFDTQKRSELLKTFIEIGFNVEFIYVDSNVHSNISMFHFKINAEIASLRKLIIPNLIISLIIMFSLEFGLYKVFQKDKKVLRARGVSERKIKILFLSIELFSDLVVIVVSQIIFSLFIYLSKLPYSLIFSLLTSFCLVFIIIFLSKLLRFVVTTNSNPLIDKQKNIKSREKRKFKISLRTLLCLMLVALFFQIIAIFEPLFWFPFFTYPIAYVIDIISIILIFLIFLKYVTTIKILRGAETGLLTIYSLISRLFAVAFRKINLQRIITFSLYFLLSYLVLFKVSDINFRTAYYANYGGWDLNINYSGDLTYDEVINLPNVIPEIIELSPITGSSSYVIEKGNLFRADLYSINSTIYASHDLGWNHFIGHVSKGRSINVIMNLKGNNIIINQYLAQKSGLRLGDKTSLDIATYYFSTNADFNSSYRINNVTIIGIVDTLPLGFRFSPTDIAYVFVDVSLILEILKNIGGSFKVESFSVDLNLNTDFNQTLEHEKINEVANKILSELHIISPTAIQTKYSDEYYSKIYEYKAETYFIIFDTIFFTFIFPTTIVLLNRTSILQVVSSFSKIINRGFSKIKLRNYYKRYMINELLNCMIFGHLSSLLVVLIQSRSRFPSLLLSSDVNLYLKLILYSSIIMFGGIIVLLLINQLSAKSIISLIKEKERKLLKNE